MNENFEIIEAPKKPGHYSVLRDGFMIRDLFRLPENTMLALRDALIMKFPPEPKSAGVEIKRGIK